MATILELAELSAAVYGNSPVPNDWKKIAQSLTPSGYYGVAYQNAAGEIVIANRGTDITNTSNLTNLLNLGSDLALTLHIATQVQKDAVDFALLIASKNYGVPIIETGHSLGGNEAQAATVALTDYGKSIVGFSVSAVTFNSPGIGGYPVPAGVSYTIQNFYDQGDAIHLAGGTPLGTSTMLPAGPNTSSLVLATPAAVAAGPIGIVALLGTALWDVLKPAHSIDTVTTYLSGNPAIGQIGWSANGLSSPLSLSGTGSSTGPTMSVNSVGALVLTDVSGNSVTLTASADNKNVNATFSGSNSPVFQQLAVLGTVSIPVSELNQVMTGLTGATTINETIASNSNIANSFNVTFQNAGSTNPVNQFQVTVKNPASVFNYVVPTNGQSVVETINNGNNTSGEVSVITDTACIPLTGGTALAGTGNTWVDGSGDQYQFTPDSIGSNIGTMTISQGLLSGADKIVIKNFNMIAAQNGGDLGITFGQQIAIVAGDNPTSPFVSGTPISQTADVPTGTTKTITIYGPAGNIQLACSGSYECVTGANTFSFANGPVNLTIPTGQNSVTVTLVDTSNSNQADTANLTASVIDASGNTVTSNSLAVTFDQPNPNTSSSATSTINGDLTPTKYSIDPSTGGLISYNSSLGAPVYRTDALGNLINDGTPNPNFNDVLYGDGGNDIINGGGGNNVLIGMGGNDTINGGSGKNIIVTGDIYANNYVPSNTTLTSVGMDPSASYLQNYGGDGNNVINGGGGQDVIIAGNGNNEIYANTQTDFDTALAQRDAATASGQKGDLIAVGDGNNTIVGGNGNDAIFTGTGNNTIVCGPGSVSLVGGMEINAASLNWTEVNNFFSPVGGGSATFNAPTPYNGSTFNGTPVGAGNDTIYGGTGNSSYWLSNGNNWLDAGGGNDLIHVGVGNNTIYGGTGNDSINGGGGSNYINLESGNDMVILQGGNQTVIGGTGNDTIISGDYTSNWETSETSANNYIQGGSGNNTILGSGGNDTLISGSQSGTGKSTLLQAGNGNEYMVGGNGSDTIFGGAGNDTIYAGNGNTGIQLSTSVSETSVVYGGNGSDTIIGGAGTDVINAGDGGTASAATKVYAGSGTSTLYGGAGIDQLFGGYGSDTLIAGTGTSTLTGGTGTEVMYSNIGNDTLIAGTGNDTLYGGGGTDVLQGSSGNTLFVAGSGNETIVGGSGHNTYLFNPGFGNVELKNARKADTFEFNCGINLTNLTFSATIGSNGQNALLVTSNNGGSLTIDGGLNGAVGPYVFLDPVTMSLDQMLAQGNSVSATVAGANGNLMFSAAGNDTLVGGTGNDTIYGWNGGNTITAGSGNQTLYSESGNDLVTGGTGNDTLISVAGNDTLIGGTGNTTFVVSSATDVIQAQATGSNTNTLESSVSYVLPANIQNLTGTGNADITLTGNDLNNTITANSDNDTLVAGTGVATMNGGSGNDTFVVNNVNDVVQAQSTGSNINTVLTSVNYVAPSNVQNLTGTGSTDITMTGNDLNNVITANSGNDTLIAGTGVATLNGGTGNDTFVINNLNDVIQAQSTGSNVNTVQTSFDYVAPVNVQNITGTGSANLTLTGNGLNNIITANSGNDTLAGGSGNSTLIGGTGQDTFVMQYNMGADTVIDSSSQGGIIQLSGPLSASDLLATRQGNDLLLQINGTNESTLIQGYYSNPQTTWTIQDASGNTVTPQAVLDATALAAQSPVTQMENAFISQTKQSEFSSLIASGYVQQPDGTYLSNPQGMINAYLANQTSPIYNSDGTFSLFYQSILGTPTTAYVLGSDALSFNFVNTTTDASVVNADNALSTNYSFTTGNAYVTWQISQVINGAFYIPYGYSTQGFSSILPPPPPNTGIYFGASTTVLNGYLGSAPSYSSTPLPAGMTLPQSIPVMYTNLQSTFEIQKINLGASDHTVYANQSTVVNSSSGNDTIYNAGFAYGGTGNDTLSGGGTLVAGSGNDLLMNGNTMIGGSGNDTLIGQGFSMTGSKEVAGSGYDFMYGSSFSEASAAFYVPLTKQSIDVIYDPASIYGGPSVMDTLILPTGVNPSDLHWRVLQSPTYPGNNVMQLNYGEANVFIVYSGQFSQPTVGVKAFQFANGAVLTFDQLMAQATPYTGSTNLTSYNPDGSYSSYTQDALGNTIAVNYESNGNKLSDNWTHADGTFGNDNFNADGSSSGTNYNLDGSHSNYTNDGHGDITTTNYDGYGNELGYSIAVNDGQETITTTSYDPYGNELGYSTAVNNGQGTITTTSYDPYGNLQGSSVLTNDGQGDTSTTTYDASGNKLGDSWTKANVSYGSDTFNADGSSSGTTYNPDGSYNSYTNDGHGDTTTTNYDAYGNELGYSNAVNDGHGNVTTQYYDANSNLLGSNVSTNDGLGDTSSTNYDASGNKQNDSWTKANGSYGSDTFNSDGTSFGASHNIDGSYSNYTNDGHGDLTTTSYDASGHELGYSIAVNNGQGNITTTNYDVNGVVLGSSVVTNDGHGNITTTNYEPNGSYQQSWSNSAGSTGSTNYNAVTGEVTGSNATAGAGYSYTYDNTQNVGGVSGVTESKVNYTYADGSTYNTDTVSDPNGSYQQTWAKSDGSSGSTNYNVATGEVTGSNATVGAGYSYTYDNTVNVGGVSGVTESKVNYTYTDGSIYSTDTVNDPNGSYQQSWSKSDGSTGSTNYNATTGEVIGSNATAGAGYSYTYDNTQNVGGISGVTESIVNYTYTGGAIYSTDTVNDQNGSYQQSWSKSDGSTGSANYNAATGEVIGSSATAGAGYGYTYDNTVNVGGVSGITESKVNYIYTGGATYSTDTVNDPNGSYQQSWSKSDGSTGSTNYNATTGEVIGSNATAGAGYSYTYDNTQNVGGTSGVSESKVAYTYADSSTYSTDTVNDPNGSYQQTWVKSDGSTGSTNYNAATGEVIGSNATAGAGYSYTYDNTQNVGGVSGVTESKVAYTYTDGSTYSTDTVNDPNGSYQQTWNKSDGSTGSTNYNAATGEVIGRNATAGAGYSYTYDNTQNVGGVSGVTESKVAYTYTDGSIYSTDTVNDPNGSYQQSWSKSDGGTGSTNYNAATGEVIGSNAIAGAGYSYSYDNTQNVGGVSGVTESKVNYTYTDGSTYNTDIVNNPDGSYFQSWSNSNGTAGSSAVNASGTLIGDSVVNADGSQVVDAGGNHLLVGSSANNNITAASGNDILIGAAGNAAITTGTGTNLIAFNAGSGQEVVNATQGQNNTISLGGNFAYSDLALQKSGNDLVLDVGTSDAITFKNWYAGSQNIVNLQVIASAMSDFAPGSTNVLSNSNVEEFNFQTMVSEFNLAQAANPSLTSWGVTNALLDAHLSESNSSALGGDLAYVYGTSGNLTGFGVSAAQGELTNSQFASAPQALNPWPTLNTGTARIR